MSILTGVYMEITNHVPSCLLSDLSKCDKADLDVKLVADCVNQCLIANFSPEETQSIKEVISARPKDSVYIDCLHTLWEQKEKETTNKIIEAVGGISAFCKLPVLPWQKELWAEDMTASLMRGVLPNGKFSLALKTEYTKDGVKYVEAERLDQLDNEKDWSVRSHDGHHFLARSPFKQDADGSWRADATTIHDLYRLANEEPINSVHFKNSVEVRLYQNN